MATAYADGPAEVRSDRSAYRALYERMSTDREPFLRRARTCAKVTIPGLVPEESQTGGTDLPTPFQSVGARGVNNLAAKLLLALFPPNVPFFKFRVAPYVLDRLAGVEQNGVTARQQVEQNLVKAEEAIVAEIEVIGMRIGATEAIKQLVVAGNALLYLPKGGGSRVYRLGDYVVERNPSNGAPTQVVVRERLADSALTGAMKALMESQPTMATADPLGDGLRTDKVYDLYTRCLKKDGAWHVDQELGGFKVPDSSGVYKPEDFEYFPLRFTDTPGENYGRGYVEEYLGDLISLEGLSQAIVEGSAAAARVLFLVNPGGVTDVDQLSTKPNGAFVDGNADDIKALQLEKFADFQVAGNTATAIETRLNFAFLLNSAVQRNAERVTAEEIRFVAQELEQVLSGQYALAGKEFQLPVIQFLVSRMTAANRLPKIPEDIVSPSIVTGLEALGRGNDLNRLRAAFGVAVEILGPEAVKYLDPIDALTRIFTASGVRAEGLVREPEELQQSNNNDRLMALVQGLGPDVIQQLGRMIQTQQSAAPAPQQQQPQ